VSVDPDLDSRLQKSARMLRGWDWMTIVSTRRTEAVDILREEARFLVQLGLNNKPNALRIGRLIVAYRRLIDLLEQSMARR